MTIFEIEPINAALHKYTADKQLYNFIHKNMIATYMLAKIIPTEGIYG